jgi:Ca2+-binding EF-hand superfamily protein
VAASIAATGYAFAQDIDQPESTETTVEPQREGNRFQREPIDLAQFSKMDALKAADANGDGSLNREEIESYALKRIVQRMADRMERRFDVDGDGTVTLAEVEKQKTKEFAALDRNEDGKLDRREMRESKSFGRHGERRGHSQHETRW